jgi:hypothetical protein
MDTTDMNTLHPVLYLYIDSTNMDLFHKYITQTEKHKLTPKKVAVGT